MTQLAESKQGMWDQIQKLKLTSPIVGSVFELYEQGMIEDKEGILMKAVLMLQEQAKAYEITNQRLMSDYYRGAKACQNYAEIQSLKSGAIRLSC